jgi:hypothetical protein
LSRCRNERTSLWHGTILDTKSEETFASERSIR